MLRDFVNKRAMLLNETMRTLATQCNRLCGDYEQKRQSPPGVEQTEPRALPKFTLTEEVCLAKCEAKMVQINKAVEKHIDDSFNPVFIKKFV